MYDMVECLYAYNINQTERIKEKYLKDFIVKTIYDRFLFQY